jgi:hypothetical protein
VGQPVKEIVKDKELSVEEEKQDQVKKQRTDNIMKKFMQEAENKRRAAAGQKAIDYETKDKKR